MDWQKHEKKNLENFSWSPNKVCFTTQVLWFYHIFGVVITHKINVLPHKKILFLIYNLKFILQKFFKIVIFLISFNRIS
jgi:hypothetical protein